MVRYAMLTAPYFCTLLNLHSLLLISLLLITYYSLLITHYSLLITYFQGELILHQFDLSVYITSRRDLDEHRARADQYQ